MLLYRNVLAFFFSAFLFNITVLYADSSDFEDEWYDDFAQSFNERPLRFAEDSELVRALYARESSTLDRLIYEHDADVNMPIANNEHTFLTLAVTQNDINTIGVLLKSGANVDAVGGEKKRTALAYALDREYLEIVQLLVDAKADINIEDADGRSPLSFAQAQGDLGLIEILNGDRRYVPLGNYTNKNQAKNSTLTASAFNVPADHVIRKGDSGRLNNGNYHALVIGIDAYRELPKLKTAINDAEKISHLLRDKYDFSVTKLINADRSKILRAINSYRKTLTAQDNLLIYFAGHGWLDEGADEGYWLPVEAEYDDSTNWISSAAITSRLRALKANHVMVVADSCFSGKLIRGVKVTARTPSYYKRMAGKKARVVLSSGGLEPVSDSGFGNNSIFAAYFIKALEDNRGVMDGTELFTKIRRPIVLNSDQTPEYSDMRKAGHDGGDFIFIRKNG